MARVIDVLVIGGGMAGTIAAVTCARAGMNTALVRQSYGATALSSGAVDLAGTTTWLRRVVGSSQAVEPIVDQAVAVFLELMAEEGYPYYGTRTRDLTLVNSVATVKTTQLAPMSMLTGNLSALENARLLVVGVNGFGDFDARYLAKSIQFFVENELVVVPIQTDCVEVIFPSVRRAANLNAFHLARLLDSDEVAEALADRIKEQACPDQYTHIVLPPIVGLERPGNALKALQNRLGRPCFEVLSLPPSVPGYRLQRALDNSAKRHGVQLIHGRAVGFTAKNGHLRSIRLVNKDIEDVYEPRVVILASGKFIGGGVQWREMLAETVFGLPVCIDGGFDLPVGVQTLITEQFTAEQRVFAVGVKVDRRLRPVAPDGRPVYSNLFAAGSVIAGYNHAQGNGGLGIPLVSGHFSAKLVREYIDGKGAWT
ncbi:MAG: anaerobic glycerol-3-phosphate dehydrogenase subunit B [Chloroflexota bacterium]